MNKVFQRFDDETTFVFLFHLERNSKLKRKIILLDFSTWYQFYVFTKNWFWYHCVISLHQSESWVFHPTVEMSVQMIVIFEEISKKQFSEVILEFILYFNEILFGVKDEFL